MVRFNLSSIIIRIFFLFFMISCARSSQLLHYERQSGSDAKAEWGMHDSKTEWCYFSGVLNDNDSNLYFFQYTLFRGVRHNFQGFAIHTALTDLTTGKHYFEEITYAPSRKCRSVDEQIICPNSIVKHGEDSLSFIVDGEVINMELFFDIPEKTVWHGDDGIVMIGDPDVLKQRAYYLSYPVLKVDGQIALSVEEEPGNKMNIPVKGQAWFDKTWGNFKIVPWQWFSLRFDDGDRVMLYYFPGTGHKEGTFIPKDGKAYTFSDFSVVSDTIHEISQDIEMAWKVSIPVKEKDYIIEPVIISPYQKSRLGITYWEGLCWLVDANGDRKGWCVVEVTR